MLVYRYFVYRLIEEKECLNIQFQNLFIHFEKHDVSQHFAPKAIPFLRKDKSPNGKQSLNCCSVGRG